MRWVEDGDGRWGFWVVLMEMEMESGRDSLGGGGGMEEEGGESVGCWMLWLLI